MMITDDEVIKKFQEFAELNLNLTDEERKKKGFQLVRGTLYIELNCSRHMYVFTKTNIIPESCFQCYKVYIEPRNVIELFKLAMVFGAPDFPIANLRKCMVEQRPYCAGAYKGFIYCKTLSEANGIRKMMKELIAERISPEVVVTVKRGCSEYAIAYPKYERLEPESNIMKYKKKWKQQEDLIDATIKYGAHEVDERDSVVYGNKEGEAGYTGKDIVCLQHWLRYAATIGDTSYLRIAASPLPPLPALAPRPRFVEKISTTHVGD